MKHSEIIKEAKKYLDDGTRLKGESAFVCFALRDSVKTNADWKRVESIQKLIRKRIHPFGTITKWLEFNGYDVEKVSACAIQDYRLRWMDSLIKEYEDAGL